MKRIPWILLLVVLLPMNVLAESPSVKEIAYGEMRQSVLERSAALNGLREEYEAASGRIFGALLPEDPEFGMDAESQPGSFEIDDRQNLEYSLSQSLPFPTKLITRGIVASKDAQIAYQRWKAAERESLKEAARLYQELVVLEKTTAMLGSNLMVLEGILRSVSSRYESSPAAQEDLLKIQIESDRTAIELFDLKEKRRPLEARIARLLGDPMDQSYRVRASEPEKTSFLSSEAILESAAGSRHELKMYRAMADKALAERSLAYQEILPDITLRYEGRTLEPSGSVEEHDSFIGLTLPVWSLLKGIGGGWKNAEATAVAAEKAYENMRREVLIDTQEAYARWRSSENAHRVYEASILPQAVRQLELARASYDSGKRDLLSVMDAIRTHREAQIASYRAEADHEIASSDLRLSAGRSA